ncbi:Scr1 family TA system antitoxin-like transcriptional regulator [Amycolatopsis sp. NPDC048633]|uniref:helix-turn-helix domain-containing protein n=1 Tax=Amycolatopsis sp. NPDC048633 TaxID=3157095 RepID=UPI0033D37B77
MTDRVPRPAVIALAGGLRDARNRRGVGLRRLADMVNLRPGVLSSFELGNRTPPDTTVAHILGVLRSPTTVCDQLVDLARRARERDFIDHTGHAENLLRAAYEQRSTQVFDWSPTLFPEALQTVEYARALRDTGLVDVGTSANRRSLALTVQELTSPSGTEPRRTYLIGEAATRPDSSSAGEFSAQLDAVIALTRHPHMSIRLVPSAVCPPGLVERFTLYENRAGAFAVAVPHHRGAVFLTHGDTVTAYKKTAKSLQRRATDNAWC